MVVTKEIQSYLLHVHHSPGYYHQNSGIILESLVLRSWESFLYHVQCLRYESNKRLPISAPNCGVSKACSKLPGFEKKFFNVDNSFPASRSSECSSNADSRKPSSINDVAMSSQSLSDILGRGEVLGVDVVAISI